MSQLSSALHLLPIYYNIWHWGIFSLLNRTLDIRGKQTSGFRNPNRERGRSQSLDGKRYRSTSVWEPVAADRSWPWSRCRCLGVTVYHAQKFTITVYTAKKPTYIFYIIIARWFEQSGPHDAIVRSQDSPDFFRQLTDALEPYENNLIIIYTHKWFI
jgi:hypothetical protein